MSITPEESKAYQYARDYYGDLGIVKHLKKPSATTLPLRCGWNLSENTLNLVIATLNQFIVTVKMRVEGCLEFAPRIHNGRLGQGGARSADGRQRMKFPKDEVRLNAAIASLMKTLQEYFPVGCRVRVPCGRGFAYGRVHGLSSYGNGSITIQYESTQRYHSKHFHEFEKVL